MAEPKEEVDGDSERPGNRINIISPDTYQRFVIRDGSNRIIVSGSVRASYLTTVTLPYNSRSGKYKVVLGSGAFYFIDQLGMFLNGDPDGSVADSRPGEQCRFPPGPGSPSAGGEGDPDPAPGITISGDVGGPLIVGNVGHRLGK